MKIGIFAASLGSGPSLTGVNTYSLALVESLYKYDKENEYILILSENNRPFYEHIKENTRWKKVFIKPMLVEDFSVIKKLYRILPMYLPFTELFKFDYKKTGFVKIPDNIINKLDLIHYTVFNSCSSIPFFINNPFIVTMHDLRLFYPEFLYKFSDKIYFTHKTMQQIFKKVAKKSKLILTEVDFVREDIKKFLNIKEIKIRVLTSPLPQVFINRLNKDVTKLPEVISKYNIPKKFLFYPSPIIRDKNHIRLIKALKLNIDKGFKINIVLSGSDGGYLREVLELIEDLNLSDYIKYIGFVPLEDLVSLYHLSYGLIMPSLHESVSLPVWEAMICGKPVATSNICGMPYQLGDLGIYFNPYDENDIANAMLKLWNLENTDEISHKLRDRAKKILDQESYAKELVKIYCEALE